MPGTNLLNLPENDLQKSKIKPTDEKTGVISNVVPPPPPPNLLNLPKNDPQGGTKSTDEKTVDRSDLLAAIRKGIKLKSKDEQKDLSQKVNKSISEKNLATIIKNALQDKFKNVHRDEDDNSEEDENQKNEKDEWNTFTDCVDSAGTQQSMFFVEIDVDQIDAVMADLEQNISQDLRLNADHSAEIIAKKVIDSIRKQAAAKQQDKAVTGFFGEIKQPAQQPCQQNNTMSNSK